VGGREARVCRGESWIAVDRVLKVHRGLLQTGPGVHVERKAPLEVTLVHVRRDRARCNRSAALLPGDGHLNLPGDGVRHLALQLQNVPQFAVIAVRPQMRVAGAMDQLHGDAHLVAFARH
jgi:hypothetical protein